jgi:hypothetical protein
MEEQLRIISSQLLVIQFVLGVQLIIVAALLAGIRKALTT